MAIPTLQCLSHHQRFPCSRQELTQGPKLDSVQSVRDLGVLSSKLDVSVKSLFSILKRMLKRRQKSYKSLPRFYFCEDILIKEILYKNSILTKEIIILIKENI